MNVLQSILSSWVPSKCTKKSDEEREKGRENKKKTKRREVEIECYSSSWRQEKGILHNGEIISEKRRGQKETKDENRTS